MSRFKWLDFISEHELDGSLIGSGTCDPESRMHMLTAPVFQNRRAVLSADDAVNNDLWPRRLAHLSSQA